MSKLKNVNSSDIADAIGLGCRTMQNVFNADDNDVPFFGSSLRPKAALSFSHGALKLYGTGAKTQYDRGRV